MSVYSERRKKALHFARMEHREGDPVWTGMCLKFVRTALGAPPVAAWAIIAWAMVRPADRHSGCKPPEGVPVFWDIGTFGHVALSAGDGYVWSTDILRRGRVDKVSIDYINRRWGARYLGWSETINARRVIAA